MAVESPNPTITRHELGRQLKSLRQRQNIGTREVARILRITDATVRRYERGDTTLKYGDLEVLLNRYGVKDPEERKLLHEMRDQADQRVWWSKYRLSDHMIKLLSFEAQAVLIRLFELACIPGPLQTKAYARAMIRGNDPTVSEETIERWLKLRLERQRRVYLKGTRPKLEVLLWEPILHTPVGPPPVMAEQLEYLLKGPYPYDVRILPLSSGAHPGMMGAFHLFEFGSLDRKPAMYVEAPRHNYYVEDEETVAAAKADFDHLWTLALDMEKSRRMIVNVLKEEYDT